MPQPQAAHSVMGTRLQTKILPNKSELKVDTENQIKLIRDFALRRKTIKIHLELTTGGTASGALKNNGVLNMIKKIKVILNETEILRSYTGLEKAIVDYFETKHPPTHTVDAVIAANGRLIWEWIFDIDFSSTRFILSNFDAVLPLPNTDSANLVIQLSNPNDIYTNADAVSLDEDKSYITQTDVILYNSPSNTNKDLKAVLNDAIPIYEGSNTREDIEREYDGFENNQWQAPFTPVPALILDTFFFAWQNVTDGNPILSNDVINMLRVRNVISDRSLYTNRWEIAVSTQLRENQMLNQPAGVLWLDWKDELQGGIRNVDADELKTVLLTPAPTAGKKNAISRFTRYVKV